MRQTSNKALCFEALDIFRDAMVAYVRKTLTTAYPTNWRTRLANTYGLRWKEMERKALNAQATGVRNATPSDEFEYIGIGELPEVVVRHFDLLFPDVVLRPRGALIDRCFAIRDARHALTGHPLSGGTEALDALHAMEDARRVLRSVDQDAQQRVRALLEEVMRNAQPERAVPDEAQRATEREPVARLFYELGQQEFSIRLIRVLQDLTDMWDDDDQAAVREARELGEEAPELHRWDWGRGPEKVALALQEWLFGPSDRLLNRLQTGPLEPPRADG